LAEERCETRIISIGVGQNGRHASENFFVDHIILRHVGDFRRAANVGGGGQQRVLHDGAQQNVCGQHEIIAARGVGKAWKYARDVARIAKRNPDYVNDPYSMGVQAMRAVLYKIDDPLPQPFVSNLRPMIALGDSRYALIPIEVRFARKGDEQIAVLKLGLADGQGGTIVWLGEVGTDPSTSATLPPDLINTLATRVANLVVAP